MSIIYLDNSATTRPSDAAVTACTEALTECYGNPSSAHALGTSAAELLNRSRNELFCALLGERVRASLPRSAALRSPVPRPYGKLIFTGSGTEADSLAIMGAAYHHRADCSKYKIITSDSEHPAVLEPIARLAEEGFKVAFIRTVGGRLDIDQLREELTPNTLLLSLMLANNETGALYDLKTAFNMAHSVSSGILCHTDAIQAFQKTPFTATSLGADMISVSGHKVHAPKGVGALWISESVARRNRLSPILLGGGQEDGLRSGTEALPVIAAFAAAVKDNGGANAGAAFTARCAKLRGYLTENLPDNVRVNQPSGAFLPHIVSITLPIPRSQPMLNFLSARGIYVSAGSACASKKASVSSALLAFGLSERDAASTIRVSLDVSTTEAELDELCRALCDGIRQLYGERK